MKKAPIAFTAGFALLTAAFLANESCGREPERPSCAETCELMHQLAGGKPGESRWVDGQCISEKVVVMRCGDKS